MDPHQVPGPYGATQVHYQLSDATEASCRQQAMYIPVVNHYDLHTSPNLSIMVTDRSHFPRREGEIPLSRVYRFFIVFFSFLSFSFRALRSEPNIYYVAPQRVAGSWLPS